MPVQTYYDAFLAIQRHFTLAMRSCRPIWEDMIFIERNSRPLATMERYPGVFSRLLIDFEDV